MALKGKFVWSWIFFATFCEGIHTITLERLGKKSYYASKSEVKWYGASKLCTDLNLEVATIQSMEEQILVTNYLVKTLGIRAVVWLDGSDIGEENNWKWTKSGENFVFTAWATGEPNNHFNQDCLVINAVKQGNNWHDTKCSKKFRVLCQEPVKEETTTSVDLKSTTEVQTTKVTESQPSYIDMEVPAAIFYENTSPQPTSQLEYLTTWFRHNNHNTTIVSQPIIFTNTPHAEQTEYRGSTATTTTMAPDMQTNAFSSTSRTTTTLITTLPSNHDANSKLFIHINESILLCTKMTPTSGLFHLIPEANVQEDKILYYGSGYSSKECGSIIKKNITNPETGKSIVSFSSYVENGNSTVVIKLIALVNVDNHSEIKVKMIEVTTAVKEREDYKFTLKLNGTVTSCNVKSPHDNTGMSSDIIQVSQNSCGFILKNITKTQAENYICNMSFATGAYLKFDNVIVHVTVNVIGSKEENMTKSIESTTQVLNFTQEHGSIFFVLFLISTLIMIAITSVFLILHKRMKKKYYNFRAKYCNILQKVDLQDGD